MNVRELRQRIATLRAQAQALLDAAQTAARDLTPEERGQFDAILAQTTALGGDVSRLEALDAVGAQIRTGGLRPVVESPEIGMTDQEAGQYSFRRAILAAADRDWRNAGLERAASEAVARRLGRSPSGFFIPADVLSRQGAQGAEQRDLVAGTPSAGGNIVATDLLSASFIDILRNRMVLRAAGATFLSDLQGNVAIPRQNGAASAYWVGENTAVTASQFTLDQVTLTPKTVGAQTNLSRRLLIQNSIDAEMLVRNDLAQILALEADRVGFHGSGASNQPLGVAGTGGVGAVPLGTNGAVPTWANIVAMESLVSVANADVGRLAYITNAKVRGKLKTTPKVAGTNDNMVWQGNDSPVNGYQAFVTNQVRSDATKGSGTALSYAFYGNWQDLFFGMWSGLDVLVDPYTGGNAGTLKVITLQDMDVAVRHPESFSLIPDMITT